MASCAHLDTTPMTSVPSDFEASAAIASPLAGIGFISVAASRVAASVAVTPRRRVMPLRTHSPAATRSLRRSSLASIGAGAISTRSAHDSGGCGGTGLTGPPSAADRGRRSQRVACGGP